MSNQSVFQEKNARLNVNNTDLVNILNTINGLPEAGSDITLQEKTVAPSTSTQNVVADSGYTGLNKVTVNAVTSSIDSDIKATNIRSGVNILGVTGTLVEHTDPVLQTKTITSSTSTQTVTPDSGYDGLSKVTVNAIATATQATPSISVSSSGLITASATQTAGYVSAGTKSATVQLTTKAATTYTPTTSNQTIASGTYLTGTQTIKGDSNLVAANIRSGKSIFGVSGTLVEGITPTGTLNITTNGTHDVTNYASANVNVPSEDLTTEINAQSTLLTNQTSKLATAISALAGKAAGGGNNELLYQILERTVTEINDSSITKFGDHSVRACSSLTSVNAPNVTTISTYAFYSCTHLTTFNAPKVTTLGTYAFYCAPIFNINFPLATKIPHSCFYRCIFLETADFGVAQSIDAQAFKEGASLEKLILRKTDSICTLANVSAFTDSLIDYGTGYVYVPDNLVDSYKSATNWSTYADQIKPLSEL